MQREKQTIFLPPHAQDMSLSQQPRLTFPPTWKRPTPIRKRKRRRYVTVMVTRCQRGLVPRPWE